MRFIVTGNRRGLRILSFIIVLVSFLVSFLSAAPMNIVTDGKPAATIVIADNPPLAVQLAVAEFNHYVFKISGVSLPIVNDKQQIEGSRILIGESGATRLLGFMNDDFTRQEYVIESRGDDLILIGYDSKETGKLDYNGEGVWKNYDIYTPTGTAYAVYDFLERCFGVRWYLPTELGEVITKRNTLKVPVIKIRRKPWTKYREMYTFQDMPEKLYHWDMARL